MLLFITWKSVSHCYIITILWKMTIYCRLNCFIILCINYLKFFVHESIKILDLLDDLSSSKLLQGPMLISHAHENHTLVALELVAVKVNVAMKVKVILNSLVVALMS